MTRYETTTLTYSAQNAAGAMYIDLTQGLSLLNAKNCSQFKDDKPLAISGTIRLTSDSESIRAAKPSWVVKNACVKTAAAWKRTLRSAGVRRKSQLNTYAREMRVALDETHSSTWGGQLANKDNCAIIPDDVDASYLTGQYVSGGQEVKVWAYAPGIGGGGAGDTDMTEPFNQYAFTQTVAAVPQSGSTDVQDKPMVLVGAVATDNLYMTGEYIDSRINDANVEDTDMDETPSIDNDLVMMLAPGEEVADDVLDNIEDEGRWRPYSYGTHNSLVDIVTPAANVAGQDTAFTAPLGLLRWLPGSATSKIVVDVHAIYEM